jgi:hypothetical protein
VRARYVRVVSEPSLFVCSIVKHDQEEIALEVGCEPSLATSLAASMGSDLRAVVGEQNRADEPQRKGKPGTGGGSGDRPNKKARAAKREAGVGITKECVCARAREKERKRERERERERVCVCVGECAGVWVVRGGARVCAGSGPRAIRCGHPGRP